MKRILLILVTPAAFLLLLWVVSDFWLLPKVAEWARIKIEEVSRESDSPASVKIGSLDLRLFSPTATLKNVEISPQNELGHSVGVVKIESIQGHLDLFEVVLGQVQLGSVTVDGVEGSIDLDPLMKSTGPAEPLPLDTIFSWTKKIPVHHILVQKGSIGLHSKKNDIEAEIHLEKALLTNLNNQLRLHAGAPEVQVKKGEHAFAVGVILSVDLSPTDLTLTQLRVRRGDLQIRMEGRSTDPAELPTHPRVQLHASTDLDLEKVGEELAVYFPNTKLPPLRGTLKAETEIKLQGTSDFDSIVRVNTTAVHVGQFEVGDAKLEGRLSPKELTVHRIELHHSAGIAEMSESRINFEAPYTFHTTVSVKKLDLQALLQSLGLKHVPVDISIAGNFPCEGEFNPISVRCQGRAVSDDLVVKSDSDDPNAKTIVELRDMGIDGEVNVDSKKVAFKSNLRIGGSKGTAEGVIDFDSGFTIKYKTPSAAFVDVKNLADLNFEGSTSIDGQTVGNAKTATFEMDMKTKDFVFEKYTLGEVAGNLAYKNGHMYFTDLHQHMNHTNVNGHFDLDLQNKTIAGDFTSPSLDIADVTIAYSKIWQFPLEVQASGKGHMTFSGPLDLWKMDYKLETEFGSGRLHGDLFDKLTFNAHADKGNLKFDKVEIHKNGATGKATGGITSGQVADIDLELSAFRLEESEFINRIHSNVAGQLNVSAKATGPIHDIDLHMKGSLSDIIVDEQEVAGSFFDLRFTKTHMEGETTLFGNRIQSDMLIPYNPGSPLHIRLKTSEWSFTSLLTVIGASSLQSEYDSSITSDIDLRSETGRFDKLSGRAAIRELRIQRGGASLRNPSPMDFIFNDGNITLKNVYLEGPNNAFIRLQGENFRTDRLAVGVQADADVRLLQLLVPFLEDIGGRLKIEASVAGQVLKPEILGNASIQNGFVKIKNFPHPVEKIQSDIVFSQKRILIQNMTGTMAGGTVDGEGSVQLIGLGNIPVNFRLRGQNLSMNVPDKVRSQGSADLTFTGSWFPFVLAGTYNCTSALVEKEFGDDGNLGAGLRSSSYLPKILREAQFDPVILDIKVPLEKNIQIHNSMMDGSVIGQIEIKGAPGNTILLGKVTTEKGSKIIFKDKPFEILTGTITFNNPDEINPDVYISAQSRVEDYDISVIIQGLAKNPAIRMSSQPPLSDQDIVSLLALGIGPTQTGTVATSTTQSQASQLGYEALGMGLAKTGAGKAVQQNTGFDVRISSNYDQIRNVSTPKVSFTRKITERLSTVYSRPISNEDNSQEIQLQYQVSPSVQAIGSYEDRDQEDPTVRDTPTVRGNIFGLDLDFKREFK